MKSDSNHRQASPGHWHRLAIAVLTCYWLAVFGSTHVPRISLPTHFNLFDKVCHFAAFGLLTFLAHLAWNTRRPGLNQLRWKDLAIVMLVIAVYGVFDEITQPLVGRSCELLDWTADVLGIVFGTLAFAGCWGLARRVAHRPHERTATGSLPIAGCNRS